MIHSADSSGPCVAPSRASSTATSLVARLKLREPDSWERFNHLYTPLVYGWSRRAGLREEDAADVAQDVFLAVAKSIANYDHDGPGATFRGWLRVITTNKLKDFFRRAGNAPAAQGGSTAHQMLEAQAGPFTSASSNSSTPSERSCFVRRALQLIQPAFTPQTWQAFWRVVIDDRTPTEVAAELSMSPGAVRTAKSRVLRRLRDELGDELP